MAEDTGEVSTASAGTIPRRHDLDALRSIAMLLGILLHGAMAYIPYPDFVWPVFDEHPSEAFSVVLSAIHGFRMPLFFLLSGFFTAMLWRKRGLGALIKQRKKRILWPLIVASLVINPFVVLAAVIASPPDLPFLRGDAEAKVSAVEAWSSPAVIRARIAAGEDPDARMDRVGATALWFAALRGDTETVALLLDAGADVDARNHDGSTALYASALYGQPDVARQLLDAGAGVDIRNRAAERPGDMLAAAPLRLEVTKLLSGLAVGDLSGRREVAELIATAGGEVPENVVSTRPAWYEMLWLALTVLPLFGHLWFLWFLCWLVAAFAIYAIVCERLDWRIAPRTVLSPLRYGYLIPLSMIPLYFMGTHFPTYGPDTFSGIIPMPAPIGYYALFFFFGVLYFDAGEGGGRIGTRWYFSLPVALCLVFPLGYLLVEGKLDIVGAATIDAAWSRPLSLFLQALYVWMMTFGLMGLSRRVFSKGRAWIRYLSDSSYWLYLIHMPLIVFAQYALRDVALPAIVKLVVVCIVVCGLMLFSYSKWIRYGRIGTALNGPRTRAEKSTAA